MLSRALDQTGDLLDHADGDALGRPTPCAEWDVAVLADHVVHDTHQFLLMVSGEQPDWTAPTPHVADDRGPAFRAGAHELLRAWRDLDGDPPLPLGMVLAEFAVHGWDLATALRRPLDTLDPQVAEQGLAFMQANLTAELRAGAFGPERPAPADAGPYDRIAAFAGRRVEP